MGIFGGIWGILGYFVDFFSGILVFHYPPWPTLTWRDIAAYPRPSDGELLCFLLMTISWDSVMLTENGRFSRLLEDLNRVNLTGYG